MPPDVDAADVAAAPAEAPAPAPAPAEAPAPAPAPAPADAPAAPPAPASSLEAAVLGLEATGLAKLDQPLPDDQVVRFGPQSTDKAGAQTIPGDPEKPADGPVASTNKADEDKPPAADEADLPEPTEAELAAAPKGLRRRFQQVRAQVSRLKDQVASVQPDAQQYQKLQTFMQSNELDARSAANALRIAALVQGAINGRVDPASVVGELTHWADQLKGLTGDHLPDDVQKRLDDGLIDEPTAKEIARLRARDLTTQRRVELDTQVQNTQVVQAKAEHIYGAVQAWERAMRARDPDFARKAKLVETVAKSLRLERYGANGMPPTVELAQQLAQEAYDQVTRDLAAALPPQHAVRAPLNGATSPKSTVRTEPKTSLEAAIQGLERMAT